VSWSIVALGEVCKVIAGQSPESKNYNQDGVGLPFYQGKKDFGESPLTL
jgi:type I restriction enzyme S subunit